MAHFFNPLRPYDEHYDNGKGTSVALNSELKLGLWAGDADLMKELVVKPSKLDVASVRDNAVPFADTPDVRYYTVKGIREGETKIEARRRGENGPVWAWMPVTVGSGLLHDDTTYFVKPTWASSTQGAKLTADNRLWRQELDLGGSAPIGLKGYQGATLGFNNPTIATYTSFVDNFNDL